MIILKFPKLQGAKIRVENASDYYSVFSSILRNDDENIRNNRHYWVMGLDGNGYINCVYIFRINHKDLMKTSLKKIFCVPLMFESVNIVLAYNVKDNERLIPSSNNASFFNKVFNLSDSVLEIQALDMMIISTNGYHSDKEDMYLDFYASDLSFKIVDDVKHILKSSKIKYAKKKASKAREKGIERGEHNKAIEIAKKMLLKNKPLEEIIEMTGLSEKEVSKLK